jgi:hypothetical protein
MMTKNSTESLVSKPKRTIKPTAKIASIIEEEEEESSGPEEPQVRYNIKERDDMSETMETVMTTTGIPEDISMMKKTQRKAVKMRKRKFKFAQ